MTGVAKHKKPPIRNRDAVVPVKLSKLRQAAEEAVDQATWLIEEALREEFGFGDVRIKRLREKVSELAKHKTFDAYVDAKFVEKWQR